MRVFFAAVALALLYVAPAAGQGFDPTPQTRLARLNSDQPSGTPKTSVQDQLSSLESNAANCVHVIVPEGYAQSHGSGVYLGDRMVLTAFHVVRKGDSGDQPYEWAYGKFRDGVSLKGKVIQFDPTWDLALIQLEADHPTLGGVPIAERNPIAGERVYAFGFGGTKGFWQSGGPVAEYSGAGNGIHDWASFRGPWRDGDSGGPVFNESHQLIGAAWGSTPGLTRFTCASRTNRFLLFRPAIFNGIRAWRAKRLSQLNQGYCYGSGCPQPIYAPSTGGSVYDMGARPTYTSPVAQPSPMPQLPSQPSLSPPSNANPCDCNPNASPCNCNADALADKVAEQLKNDPAMRGEPGKDGINGKDGRDGVDGASATPDQIANAVAYFIASNPELIADEIQPHLDPIYPRWIDKDGKTIDEVPGGIRLGQVMQLRQDIVTRLVEKDAGTKPE